jgi:hypothetical protein
MYCPQQRQIRHPFPLNREPAGTSMTQLTLFGDDQQTQKPAKNKKRQKSKPTYSSPTIVIIDRRTNINFNVTLLKVSLVSVALCLTPSSSTPNFAPPSCETVATDTLWPSLTCRTH